MKFLKQGRAYQIALENGCDLEDALKLDIALWVAISAPKSAFVCDAKFLELLNDGKSANITTEDVRKAISWMLERLPDHKAITNDFNGVIPLNDIADSESGQALVDSAKYILDDMGVEDKSSISLDTIRKFQNEVKSRPLNGDGVISIASASVCRDGSKCELMAKFVDMAAKATGGTPDADGTQGVTEAQFQTFWNAIPEYLAWLKLAEIPEGAEKTAIMVFGGDTPARLELFKKGDALVRNYFRLCKLIAFDSRLADRGLSTDGKAVSFDPAVVDGLDAYLAEMPIAKAAPGAKLPVDLAAINPIYQGWWAEVVEKLVRPVLGDIAELTLGDWDNIGEYLSPYVKYLADCKGGICADIDPALLADFAKEAEFPALAADLSCRDAAVTNTLARGQEVERLLLYRRWMLRFVNNYISFSDLYGDSSKAMFERGSIVIDGRWFKAVFPVDNQAAHAAVAAKSFLFVAYFKILFPNGTTKIVVAPVTIGSKGNLAVGKRGVYFDSDGSQYPVEVVQIIDNPVCIWEAMAAPFNKISKMLEGKVESWSSGAEKAFEGKVGGVINNPGAAAAAAKPADTSKDKGSMLMGAGIAFAALGSAAAFISKTLAGMSGLAIAISVICIILALMLPISIMVIIKLRRQDLSSLLEGNGWAINARMRLNNKLRRHFSRTGIFPKDAVGTPVKRLRRNLIIVALLIVIAAAAVWGYQRWKEMKAQMAAQACEVPAVEVQAEAEAPAPAEPTTAEAEAAPTSAEEVAQ